MVKATIIRHPKERLSKCSLEPLRGRGDLVFYKATRGERFDVSGKIILAVDAPPLSQVDAGNELVLLDSTWRLLPDLEASLEGEPTRRSLPAGLLTAYPRVSKISEDPQGGLASVEALYAALWLLGHICSEMLDAYYWKDVFLEINRQWFEEHS
ncbi:MAG: DUF367 domain-containing protein [Opitutales bacterium]|nr:DUF367 domain-containing protein [Opitutales bacterium]